MDSNSQQTYQTYNSKEERKQGGPGGGIPIGAGGRKQQPHQATSNSYGSQVAGTIGVGIGSGAGQVGIGGGPQPNYPNNQHD